MLAPLASGSHRGICVCCSFPQHILPSDPIKPQPSHLSCHLLQEALLNAPGWIRTHSGLLQHPVSPLTALLPSWACHPPGWEPSPHPENMARPQHVLDAYCMPGPTWHFNHIILVVTSIAEVETEVRGRHCRQGRPAQTPPAATSICSVSLSLKG